MTPGGCFPEEAMHASTDAFPAQGSQVLTTGTSLSKVGFGNGFPLAKSSSSPLPSSEAAASA